jgi:hypothetical protein
MNDAAATWQEGNTRYVSAALLWLRACLEHRAAQVSDSARPVIAGLGLSGDDRPFWRNSKKNHRASAPLPKLLPASAEARPESVTQAAALVQRIAQEMNPPPALLILGRRLGLSEFERQLLLLCLAMELDPAIAPLCARCQGKHNQDELGRPTFALAFNLFDDPSWEALSPERPLRYWRLIEINQPGGHALTMSPLRADERIVNYLKGLNYLDDRLAPLLVPIDMSDQSELPPSQQEKSITILHALKQAEVGKRLPVVQLLGNDSASKQLVAADVARSIGLHLYQLPAALLPSQASDLEALSRLWQRESLLLPLALYVDAFEPGADLTSHGQGSSATRLLELTNGAIFLDTRESWPSLNRSKIAVDIAKPTVGEQQSAWESALNSQSGNGPALLASQFNLSVTDIGRIAQQTLADPAPTESSLHDRLWKACLLNTRPRLDTLAQRLEPRMTWDDLILPVSESSLLQQIAEQVAQRITVYEKWGFGEKMSRGLGISALFAGDSGTGKTMAAEVIASHLRLDLYRIDLSAVVSKYIGETEKNLRRLFDAAEHGGAILFFDEADALFGKRSEVKDSHDRYANIEINYLLQRMESYRGLAILATNMKSALDQAFLRRLRFVVNFPFPGAAERKAIWQKVFPSGVPKSDLDCDRLARLNMTGGNIYNVALNAAFMAARAGTPVTMPLVLDAARAEFRKLERPINEQDFRWQVPCAGAVA